LACKPFFTWLGQWLGLPEFPLPGRHGDRRRPTRSTAMSGRAPSSLTARSAALRYPSLTHSPLTLEEGRTTCPERGTCARSHPLPSSHRRSTSAAAIS